MELGGKSERSAFAFTIPFSFLDGMHGSRWTNPRCARTCISSSASTGDTWTLPCDGGLKILVWHLDTDIC